MSLVLLSPFFKKSVKFLGIFDEEELTITLSKIPLKFLSLFFKGFSRYVSAAMSMRL